MITSVATRPKQEPPIIDTTIRSFSPHLKQLIGYGGGPKGAEGGDGMEPIGEPNGDGTVKFIFTN